MAFCEKRNVVSISIEPDSHSTKHEMPTSLTRHRYCTRIGVDVVIFVWELSLPPSHLRPSRALKMQKRDWGGDSPIEGKQNWKSSKDVST